MQIQKVRHLQGFRLTLFGKILISSLSVFLVISFVIIIGNSLGKGNSQPSTIPPDKVVIDNPPSNTPSDISSTPPIPADTVKESLKSMYLTIYFYPNSPEIKNESYQTLNAFVALSNAAEGLTVQIEGNTAKILNTLDTPLDDELSQKRAQAVAGYMTEKGIPANRLRIITNGTSKPAVSNETESGRKLNRRVDIYFK